MNTVILPLMTYLCRITKVVRSIMNMMIWSKILPLLMTLLHVHTPHLTLLTLLQVPLPDTSPERNMIMSASGPHLTMSSVS